MRDVGVHVDDGFAPAARVCVFVHDSDKWDDLEVPDGLQVFRQSLGGLQERAGNAAHCFGTALCLAAAVLPFRAVRVLEEEDHLDAMRREEELEVLDEPEPLVALAERCELAHESGERHGVEQESFGAIHPKAFRFRSTDSLEHDDGFRTTERRFCAPNQERLRALLELRGFFCMQIRTPRTDRTHRVCDTTSKTIKDQGNLLPWLESSST